MAQVCVRVPATSANLGPGFDALGLALGLYDELTLRTSEDPGLRVQPYGGAPTDESNLVVRAVRAGFAAYGTQPAGLELQYRARIPQARGLGSSAAAICAGVSAALAVGGISDRSLALSTAFALETHPDNLAAALYGGLTVAWTSEAGEPAAVQLAPAPTLVAVAFVPTQRTSTSESRTALPQVVAHADAARTAGRAALLVAALTSNPRELLAATADWLHQPYRLDPSRGAGALIQGLRSAGVPAVLSGSGPAVLGLCRDEAEAALAISIASTLGERTSTAGYEPQQLPIDLDGTTCTLLD